MNDRHPHRPEDLEPDSPEARSPDPELRVRLTRSEDIPELVNLSRRVYVGRGAWLTQELHSHQEIFPEGQIVVVDRQEDRPIGMTVGLIVRADAWPLDATWSEITGNGMLTTHDPEGDTLYGAGLAVDPETRGRGVARLLYTAREALLERFELARIRAGARLAGYAAVADRMSPEAYVEEVVRGRLRDPALSFQLHLGFRVLAVARDYLPVDRESLGHAAVVEWEPGEVGHMESSGLRGG